MVYMQKTIILTVLRAKILILTEKMAFFCDLKNGGPIWRIPQISNIQLYEGTDDLKLLVGT